MNDVGSLGLEGTVLAETTLALVALPLTVVSDAEPPFAAGSLDPDLIGAYVDRSERTTVELAPEKWWQLLDESWRGHVQVCS